MHFRTRIVLPLVLSALATVAVGVAAGGATAPARHPVAHARGSLPVLGAAARRVTACGTGGMRCSSVVVPLDRSGRVPGTVTLHVESLPATGAERGVMLLLAGGPGQGSAAVFDLGDEDAVTMLRALFPGYRLVAFDSRGTGASGLLDCPGLQHATTFAGEDALATVCAETIGPTRDFYSTRDHADDIEAVRAALGVDRLAIWGTSYGTKLALAYALGYPTHVERLLLDSVLLTDYPDPFEANVLRALPQALTGLCAGGACRAATPSFAADVVAVANRLAATPARGTVRRPGGGSKIVTMGGLEMLGLVVDSDVSPGLAAALPAATRAARQGSTRPLLRLLDLDAAAQTVPAKELSAGLYAATTCADGHFPWDAATAPGDRAAALSAAVAALPAGALGPFGPWAAELGTSSFCVSWPSPAVPTPALGTGPLPDVPVLAVSGGYDMRTPTSSATAVVRSFPHGHVLVVPGVGHGAVTVDTSSCTFRAVRSWMAGGRVPSRCPRAPFLVRPSAAYPPAAAPARRATPQATATLVRRTLADAEAVWLVEVLGPGRRAAGLTSGTVTPGAGLSMRLDRYGIVAGVEVSGRIRAGGVALPLRFDGTVTVGGARAAHGTLRVHGDVLSGRLAAPAGA